MEVNRSSSKSKGFTIIEVLITIAVAAILLGVAVPSLQNFTANSQVAAASNSIVSGLNLARSTAVTLGERVAVCPSSNESTCSDEWDKGWIVFDDSDGLGVPVVAEMVRVAAQTGNFDPTPAQGPMVVFDSLGAQDPQTDFSIEICYSDTSVTNQCRQISVSRFGVISSTKTTTSC